MFHHNHAGRKSFGPSWILKILAKKLVFLVLSGKEQISPLLDPVKKVLKKFPSGSPWKKSF